MITRSVLPTFRFPRLSIPHKMVKEIEALSKLEHPCIVEFVGAIIDPPNLAVVTKFMPRGSLHHLLHCKAGDGESPPRLNYDQQLTMSMQIIEGIEFLHSQKPPFVHRDLKSLNILLDESYNCKICDFGLTQTMDKTYMSSPACGSPRYMAPECYETNGRVTEKVDIWAAGCIFSEIFGGGLPFEECSSMEQIVKKLLVDRCGPAAPSFLTTPNAMEETIFRCLKMNQVERPTAGEIFQSVSEIARAEGVPYAHRRSA